ncbi:MAG: glutamate 5-kinase [Aggregatilineales bacterium]
MADSHAPIIVKLGTSVLTDGTRHIARRRMLEIVRQVAHLHDQGRAIALVSSGAIAAGREALAYPDLDPSLPRKQMLAAVGQGRLIQIYSDLFSIFGITVGQVLLTRSDLNNPVGRSNARNTLNTLFAYRVVPIINENDTVATEEIQVGDNDNLSALVADLVDAALLILLTDQRGLFEADPRTHPEATLIPFVARIDEAIWARAGGTSSGLGTGGMITKLQAAQLATARGTPTVIADGRLPDVIVRAAQGEAVGTTFAAAPQTDARLQDHNGL